MSRETQHRLTVNENSWSTLESWVVIIFYLQLYLLFIEIWSGWWGEPRHQHLSTTATKVMTSGFRKSCSIISLSTLVIVSYRPQSTTPTHHHHHHHHSGDILSIATSAHVPRFICNLSFRVQMFVIWWKWFLLLKCIELFDSNIVFVFDA